MNVLDFGFLTGRGLSAQLTLKSSIDAVRLAEQVGLHRYWLAEHHVPEMAWANTEVAIGVLAHSTSTIRVGAGGLLLSTQNALRVACDFSFLSQCFPDRIDLGIARGLPGKNTSALLDEAERYEPQAHFERQLSHLLGYLERTPRPHSESAEAQAIPVPAVSPQIWLLGSGELSGRLAAQRGLGFAFSTVHSETAAISPVQKYREAFNLHSRSQEPTCALLFAGWCCASMELAQQHQTQPRLISLSNLRAGDIDYWTAMMLSVVRKYDIWEVFFGDLCIGPSDRLRTVECLGEVSRRVNRSLGINSGQLGMSRG